MLAGCTSGNRKGRKTNRGAERAYTGSKAGFEKSKNMCVTNNASPQGLLEELGGIENMNTVKGGALEIEHAHAIFDLLQPEEEATEVVDIKCRAVGFFLNIMLFIAGSANRSEKDIKKEIKAVKY